MNLKCIHIIITPLQVKILQGRQGRDNCQESHSAATSRRKGFKLGLLTPKAGFCPPHLAASHQDDKLTSNCRIVPMEKIALPGQRVTDWHKMLALEVVLKGIAPNPLIYRWISRASRQSTDLSNQGGEAGGNAHPCRFTGDERVCCSVWLGRNQKADGVQPGGAFRSTGIHQPSNMSASHPDPAGRSLKLVRAHIILRLPWNFSPNPRSALKSPTRVRLFQGALGAFELLSRNREFWI